MTLESLAFLTSEAGQQLLAELTQADLREDKRLALLTQLRKRYEPEQAAVAVSMAELRRKARDKFGTQADKLLFTADALQQASHPAVREYRAGNITAQTVFDVCCGIGADTLAFAEQGLDVLGLDIDPVRVAIAQHNAQVTGLSNARFAVRDAHDPLPGDAELVFYDPARRDADGRRIYHVEQYIPPLSLVKNWRAQPIMVMVKLSPGVDQAQLSEYGGLLEFISVQGDLKEAVLHLGESMGVKATLIDDTGTHHLQRDVLPDVPIRGPLGWLIEPDPAIIRAGLVQDVAAQFGGAMLDETIAYFTTMTKPVSPWVRAWQVLDWMPFNLKKLKAYLRAHNIGTVTVKKRGSPMTPESLIAKLKLKSKDKTAKSATLVLTRHHTTPIVLICANYVP